MRAPLPGVPARGLSRGPSRGLLHRLVVALVLALVALLVATLVGPAPDPAAATAEPTAPPTGATTADTAVQPAPGPAARDEPAPRMTLPARAADDGRDRPELPSQCFGPGRSRIEPFPCPLNWNRRGRPVVLLWGDSHAYQYIPALVEAVKGQGVNLVSMVAGSCPPVLVTTDPGPSQCRRSNWIAYRYVRELQRQGTRFKVVVGSNWSGFRRGYRSMYLEAAGGPATGYVRYTRQMISMAHEGTPALFDRLGSLGVDVDLIGQSATVPARRPACAPGEDPYLCDVLRWRAIPEEYATRTYLQRLRARIARRGESRVIDATPGYCTATVCRGRVGEVESFYDDLHLSATRTRRLASYFVPAVAAVRR